MQICLVIFSTTSLKRTKMMKAYAIQKLTSPKENYRLLSPTIAFGKKKKKNATVVYKKFLELPSNGSVKNVNESSLSLYLSVEYIYCVTGGKCKNVVFNE